MNLWGALLSKPPQYSSLFSIVCPTPWLKATQGRETFLAYTIPITILTEEIRTGTQSRNLEAGTEAETMEKCSYWLAPCCLLSLPSYISQGHLPAVVQPTVG